MEAKDVNFLALLRNLSKTMPQAADIFDISKSWECTKWEASRIFSTKDLGICSHFITDVRICIAISPVSLHSGRSHTASIFFEYNDYSEYVKTSEIVVLTINENMDICFVW